MFSKKGHILLYLGFSKGASGKIVVMGTTAFDLSVDEKISMTGKELVQKIIEPNGINIVF